MTTSYEMFQFALREVILTTRHARNVLLGPIPKPRVCRPTVNSVPWVVNPKLVSQNAQPVLWMDSPIMLISPNVVGG